LRLSDLYDKPIVARTTLTMSLDARKQLPMSLLQYNVKEAQKGFQKGEFRNEV
jgi:hypothetical protein